jgi:23S rRNA (uracil1939-C5)-methyltransferase
LATASGPAGGPVYAARALPGEVIEGEIEGDRIEAPRIVTPSPDRVAAPCRITGVAAAAR